MRDLVPGDKNIRLIHLESAMQIGAKRNLGCAKAQGEIIAHWDDDDFSAPERLTDQINRLRESGKSVTGYHSMKFTDGERWWQYAGALHYSLGTSLCYSRNYWKSNPFPAMQVGEDNALVASAWRQGQLATADAGELMYATNHPNNTSPRVMGSNWKALN